MNEWSSIIAQISPVGVQFQNVWYKMNAVAIQKMELAGITVQNVWTDIG